MAIYKHRRSFDSDPIEPLSREIEIGEIVINMVNKTMWTKNDANNVVSLTRTENEIRAIVEDDSDGSIASDDIVGFRIDTTDPTEPVVFILRDGTDHPNRKITTRGTNFIDPTAPRDYANKGYVDKQDSDLENRVDTKISNLDTNVGLRINTLESEIANLESEITALNVNTAVDVTSEILNNSPLVFVEDGSIRRLTKFRDSEDNEKTIRQAKFNDTSDLLEIILASFTPTLKVYPRLTSDGDDSRELNWDDRADGFSVKVINPADFTDRFITSVNNTVTEVSGSVTTSLSSFDADPATRDSERDAEWTQSFETVGTTAVIRPFDGEGSLTAFSDDERASLTLTFDENSGEFNTDEASSASDTSVTYKWNDPEITFNTDSLGDSLGNVLFLKSINSGRARVSYQNISTDNNVSADMSSIDGTIGSSNDRLFDGAGNNDIGISFTDVFTKDTTSGKTITAETTYARPTNVTGTPYDVTPTAISRTFSVPNFTYPVLVIFAKTREYIPVSDDFVNGDNIRTDSNDTDVVSAPVVRLTDFDDVSSSFPTVPQFFADTQDNAFVNMWVCWRDNNGSAEPSVAFGAEGDEQAGQPTTNNGTVTIVSSDTNVSNTTYNMRQYTPADDNSVLITN